MAEAVVVIGVGAMGQAIARRQGGGRVLVLADIDDTALKAAAGVLRSEGHEVQTYRTDISSSESVADLADAAAAAGEVTQVVHTAGLSPTQASAATILAVDLLGVALVVEQFGRVVQPGASGVVIASMAGHMFPTTAEQDDALAQTPAENLLGLPFIRALADPGLAYGMAKRANHIRVAAASVLWGQRLARINTLSPGIISTPMSQQELAAPTGSLMRMMLASSAAKRLGTPDDIATAAAFLLSPAANFITGADLLVDGGATAAARTGHLVPPEGDTQH